MSRSLVPRVLAPLVAVALALAACDSGTTTVRLAERTGTLSASAGPDTALYALQLDRMPAEDADSLSAPEDRRIGSDSLRTTFWDLGLRGTDVFLNSGASGPGAAVGTVVDRPFEDVEFADSLGTPFRRDGESPCVDGPARAVCPPGDSPFALFQIADNGVEPVPGRTLVLRLADAAGFAKLEVLAYDAEAGDVTVRYLVNPAGPALQPGRVVPLDR